jgi:hypothetical protein
MYGEWAKNRKPGGPDKLLPTSVKKLIFTQILQGIFDEGEIKSQWEIVSKV